MIKVASYCRVSTDREDQSNSFSSQVRFFTEYIDRNPDWDLYRIYSDEGITGTSTQRRVGFNSMIQDARSKKFDLIITKEVSRFSRNILDTISFTRELKSLGIGVIFMNDGINTMDSDSELRLSIMSSIAQEESRKTSMRVKWGQIRQMERGVVFGNSLLGYTVENGKIRIEPIGAELVRQIFMKYGIERKGTVTIAKELQEAGIRTPTGKTAWSCNQLLRVLKNEKYVGDLIQKKSITPDYLTHKSKRNQGEEDLIIIRNHHEPIIDRDLWDTVQEEIKKRDRHNQLNSGYSNEYKLSGKIQCGECGASYIVGYKKRKDDTSYRRWRCHHSDQCSCGTWTIFRDELAIDIVDQAFQIVLSDPAWLANIIIDDVNQAIALYESSCNDTKLETEHQIHLVLQKKEALLDAFFSGEISKEDLRVMKQKYDSELSALQEKEKSNRMRMDIQYDKPQIERDIKRHIANLILQDQSSDVFYKTYVDRLLVFPGKRTMIKLNLLPNTVFRLLNRMVEYCRNLSNQDDSCHEGCLNPKLEPISVRRPFSSSKGMEYRWDRYLKDAPSSPSGPPYWVRIILASRGFGLSIFTGYWSFLL